MNPCGVRWKIWPIDHTAPFRTLKNLQTRQNLVQCDRKMLSLCQCNASHS